MATIKRRKTSHGETRYQAKVRRPGYPTQSKTFVRRDDARAWTREMEARMDRGDPLEAEQNPEGEATIAELVAWYLECKTPYKRGDAAAQQAEHAHLQALLRHPLAQRQVKTVDTADYARYRDDRLKQVRPATVRREFAVIRHLHKVAAQERRAQAKHGNPAQGIELPSDRGERTRRLKPGEEALLLEAAAQARTAWPYAMVALTLAVPTRRSDLLRLRWSEVELDPDHEVGQAFVPMSKNGDPRWIPLPRPAYHLLMSLPQLPGDDRVIPLDAEGAKSSWRRTLTRARKLARERGQEGLLADLRFHDLKHEATSRLVEAGSARNAIELSFMAGQKDPRMLRRYTHLDSKDLAKRMNGATPPQA